MGHLVTRRSSFVCGNDYPRYREGGFRERAIGTAQVLLGKPLNRREALLPVLPIAEEQAA